VDVFLDRMQAAGKVSPAERARLAKRLTDTDDVTAQKFGENGKTWEETPFKAALAEIESRPSYFGEKIPAGPDAPATQDEEGKVQKFAEANRARYARFSQTPADVVSAFKNMKSRDETLTAEKFLNA